MRVPRVCYICAETASDVAGLIPLCPWCARNWAKSRNADNELRTELRTETVDSDDKPAWSLSFDPFGN